MKKSIYGSDLRAMSPDAQRRALSELVQATRSAPNGELKAIEDEIGGYEKRRGMTSEDMRRELAEGRILETREICQWLIALKLRDRLVSATSRT